MPVCSLASKVAAQAMADRNFAPAFPVDLIEKDLAYLGLTTTDTAPVSTAAHAVFTRAIAEGFGAENMTAVARLYI